MVSTTDYIPYIRRERVRYLPGDGLLRRSIAGQVRPEIQRVAQSKQKDKIEGARKLAFQLYDARDGMSMNAGQVRTLQSVGATRQHPL